MDHCRCCDSSFSTENLNSISMQDLTSIKPNEQKIAAIKYIGYDKFIVPVYYRTDYDSYPLLPILNALSLQGRLNIPLDLHQESIPYAELVKHLRAFVSEISPSNSKVENLEQKIKDSLKMIDSLKKFIDIDIKFKDISSFVSSKEMALLEVLDLDLYHCWVVDPKYEDTYNVVSEESYQEILEKTNEWSDYPLKSPEYDKFRVASRFFDMAIGEMTEYGLEMLRKIPENKISLFFKNKNFHTIIRKGSHVLMLITDFEYLFNTKYIWENMIFGAKGYIYDSQFNKALQFSERRKSDSPEQSENEGKKPYIDVDKAYEAFLQDFSSPDTTRRSTNDFCKMV